MHKKMSATNFIILAIMLFVAAVCLISCTEKSNGIDIITQEFHEQYDGLWKEWDSIGDAESYIGFDFGLPEVVEGSYTVKKCRTLKQDLFEATYQDEEYTIVIRKANRDREGLKDISGADNNYDHVITDEYVNIETLFYYTDNDNAQKILFLYDDYIWSIVAPIGFWGDSAYGFLTGIHELEGQVYE